MRLTDKEIELVAQKYDIEFALIKAVAIVESINGAGFFNYKTGPKIKILFEGHVFWSQLIQFKLSPLDYQKGNENIIYKKWTKAHYSTLSGEHRRLEQAKKIHEEAALKSASWGLFQQLGLYHAEAGYNTVHEMVSAYQQHEKFHLDGLMKVLENRNLIKPLKNKEWSTFARAYNGQGFEKNKYHIKLKNEYEKIKKQSV